MVEKRDVGGRQVSRRIVVNAPASELYEFTANPHRHAELDGGGTVQGTISGPEQLTTGDTFSTQMKQFGKMYRTTSTVTKSEPNRVVEWQLGIGQKWRWEFEELDATTTRVTETWDIEEIPAIAAIGMRLGGMYGRNAKGIEKSLQRLQQKYEREQWPKS